MYQKFKKLAHYFRTNISKQLPITSAAEACLVEKLVYPLDSMQVPKTLMWEA
jgi:hypothetical protein